MEQKTVSAGGMSLLTGLLTLSPAKRLTATAALTHPYYTDDNHSDDHKTNKISGFGGIAEEVGEDDESFDGDFSDVEDTHPATNDDDSFDDDDEYTDDDGFDDEDDSERPDSPVLAVYKAVQTTITEPKQPKSTRSHKEITQEAASQKSHRSKHKRKKRHRDKNEGKHKPKETGANTVVEQSSSKHQKKKHRQRKEHEKQKSKHGKPRRRKKDAEGVANRDGTSSKASHRRQRKGEVPSYARATTAASARSRRSRSKNRAPKDKKRSKKKGKHKSKSGKR